MEPAVWDRSQLPTRTFVFGTPFILRERGLVCKKSISDKTNSVNYRCIHDYQLYLRREYEMYESPNTGT